MAFNGRFILQMTHFAARRGANTEQLLQLSGQTVTELQQEQSTVSDDTYNRIAEQIITDTKDPFFGLHLGECMHLTAAGLIGQITQSAASVKQALELCCQFANLGCSALPLGLYQQPTAYQLRWQPSVSWAAQSPLAMRHTAEGMMVFTLREFQSLVRQPQAPIAVYLPWPAPSSMEEHRRIFGAPIHFNSQHIAIDLPINFVEQPIITADYELLRILVAYAEKKSANLQAEYGFLATVRQIVTQMQEHGFPAPKQVARHLNMSLRSFQRQLNMLGYNYQQLVDQLRQEMAMSYLRNPQLSVSEVGYLLHYADNTAFSRAFKRWQGISPSQWRSTQLVE